MPDPTVWRTRAACLDANPDLFDGPDNAGFTNRAAYAPALAICATCPVAQPCLAEAMVTDSYRRYTIRGGLLPAERAALARAMEEVS